MVGATVIYSLFNPCTLHVCAITAVQGFLDIWATRNYFFPKINLFC